MENETTKRLAVRSGHRDSVLCRCSTRLRQRCPDRRPISTVFKLDCPI